MEVHRQIEVSSWLACIILKHTCSDPFASDRSLDLTQRVLQNDGPLFLRYNNYLDNMSLLGGILQSLLTSAAKDALVWVTASNKRLNRFGCGCLAVIGLLSAAFLWLMIWTSKLTAKRELIQDVVWTTVTIGDSLFVKGTYGINFYKKGRTKLDRYDQRQIKYAREDTVEFIEVNNVDDRFFYKSRTSFIGICIGIDSVVARNGNRWLMIKPSYAVTHPPRRKDDYDFETRRWENKKYDIVYETKLSKDFYVRPEDVLLSNNDSLFK